MNLFELEKIYKIKLIEKQKIDEELISIKDKVSKLYEIYKEYNDEDMQIYIEKKMYKWNNAKISVKHGGINKWKINRIIKKFEEETE